MARGFFSRVIADARRPLPVPARTKWNPGQRSTTGMPQLQEPAGIDAGIKPEAISPASKSQPSIHSKHSSLTQERSVAPLAEGLPTATTALSGQRSKSENSKEQVVYPSDKTGLSEQQLASIGQQNEPVLPSGHQSDTKLPGTGKIYSSRGPRVIETTIQPSVATVESVLHQKGTEADSLAKQSMDAEQASINTDRQHKTIQQSVSSVPAEIESSNSGEVAEISSSSELHAEREGVSVVHDDGNHNEAVLNQAALITISDVNQPVRPPATAEPNPAPQIHIGRVDVVVIADHKEAPKQQLPSSDGNFSSRNYLRRL